MTPPVRQALCWLGLLLLVGLYALAAIPKIAHPEAFAKAVYGYRMLPDGLVNLVALGLPWLEALVAICLLFGPTRRPALAWAILLLVLFTGAQVINLFRGVEGVCGCFSAEADSKPISWMGVAMNTGFLLVGLVLWRAWPEDPAPTAAST